MLLHGKDADRWDALIEANIPNLKMRLWVGKILYWNVSRAFRGQKIPITPDWQRFIRKYVEDTRIYQCSHGEMLTIFAQSGCPLHLANQYIKHREKWGEKNPGMVSFKHFGLCRLEIERREHERLIEALKAINYPNAKEVGGPKNSRVNQVRKIAFKNTKKG